MLGDVISTYAFWEDTDIRSIAVLLCLHITPRLALVAAQPVLAPEASKWVCLISSRLHSALFLSEGICASSIAWAG